jgi:hypothetical protein
MKRPAILSPILWTVADLIYIAIMLTRGDRDFERGLAIGMVGAIAVMQWFIWSLERLVVDALVVAETAVDFLGEQEQ